MLFKYDGPLGAVKSQRVGFQPGAKYMITSHEQIRSVSDLLSIADAMERESADWRRALAARLKFQGDAALAEEFEALAKLEDGHVNAVVDRARAALGKPPGPAPAGWRSTQTVDETEARAALGDSYQALAFAVRNEERAFAYYTYVAAAADDAAVRALAEDLARDELAHAARLRRLRRQAFHRDRPAEVEIPTTVERLRDLVREWEGYAAIAHAELAERITMAGREREADIFRRLAREEAGVAGSPHVAPPSAPIDEGEGLRLLERHFDRMALIGERAKSEAVMAEAQNEAQRALVRLMLVADALREARENGQGA